MLAQGSAQCRTQQSTLPVFLMMNSEELFSLFFFPTCPRTFKETDISEAKKGNGEEGANLGEKNPQSRMSGGGLWGAYNRLSKGTRLRLGVAGILFSVLGIVASPGTSSRFAFFGLMMLGCRDCGSQYFQNIAGFMSYLRLAQRV